MNQQHLITRINGWDVIVEPGEKSQFDFIVRYRQRGKRIRTPKHIHLVIDLYIKQAHNRPLVKELIGHMLTVLDQLRPITEYPPALQIYRQEHVERFEDLNNYGEYPVSFLLVIFELIMLQEKTNYPCGTLNKTVFEKFLNDADIFSIVSAATFRGR